MYRPAYTGTIDVLSRIYGLSIQASFDFMLIFKSHREWLGLDCRAGSQRSSLHPLRHEVPPENRNEVGHQHSQVLRDQAEIQEANPGPQLGVVDDHRHIPA